MSGFFLIIRKIYLLSAGDNLEGRPLRGLFSVVCSVIHLFRMDWILEWEVLNSRATALREEPASSLAKIAFLASGEKQVCFLRLSDVSTPGLGSSDIFWLR